MHNLRHRLQTSNRAAAMPWEVLYRNYGKTSRDLVSLQSRHGDHGAGRGKRTSGSVHREDLRSSRERERERERVHDRAPHTNMCCPANTQAYRHTTADPPPPSRRIILPPL